MSNTEYGDGAGLPAEIQSAANRIPGSMNEVPRIDLYAFASVLGVMLRKVKY